MRIINQTQYNLTIDGDTVEPGHEYLTDEMMFNTQPIYSDIGAVEITTEYGVRSFKCYGKLEAYEDTYLKDENGLAQIIVHAHPSAWKDSKHG